MQKYNSHQKENDHPDLLVSPSRFIINPAYSFLGASPDVCVYDPYNTQHPFGFSEVKCPYTLKDCTVEEACTTKNRRQWKNYLKKRGQVLCSSSGTVGTGGAVMV